MDQTIERLIEASAITEPTKNYRTSTSEFNQTTNPILDTSRPGSIKSNHDDYSINSVSPNSPVTTNPEKVTVRSVRSFRNSLPSCNNSIIVSENSGRALPLSILQCLKTVLFATKINVLLIFIPLGIIAAKLHWPDVAVFILNFIAIIPLANLLGYATEEIALRLGENFGALLNASFGNAVELILSIIALKEKKIDVVQASLLGSILSDLLLVLGFCFVTGGYKFKTLTFNQTAAQTSASLLSLSCLSLFIPAALQATVSGIDQTTNIQHISYGTSIVLLVIYVLYLIFQLKTHSHFYLTCNEDEEEPVLPLWLGVVLLLVITVFVAFCAEFLVDSISGLSKAWGVSNVFIGLILLPIVGNAAEHVAAISLAMKNKMDLAIGIAIGASMQIAMFVIPLMVIIGWIIGMPMTLFFNMFETCILFITVLIVNYLIQDGETNWLEGTMLLGTYVILAIAIYYYPASAVATPH